MYIFETLFLVFFTQIFSNEFFKNYKIRKRSNKSDNISVSRMKSYWSDMISLKTEIISDFSLTQHAVLSCDESTWRKGAAQIKDNLNQKHLH